MKTFDRVFEWIFTDNRDQCERMRDDEISETDGPNIVAILMIAMLTIGAFGDWDGVGWLRLYLISMVGSFFLTPFITKRFEKGSTYWEEFGHMVACPGEAVFFELLVAPLFLPLHILLRRSSRDYYEHRRFHFVMKHCYGIHNDTAAEWSRRDSEDVREAAAEFREASIEHLQAAKELPLQTARAGALATTLVAGAGVQHVLAQDSTKTKPPVVSLQADLRSFVQISDSETIIGGFGRFTATAKRWFAETVNVITEKSSTHDAVVGPGIGKKFGTTNVRLNFAVGGNVTSKGNFRLLFGPQIFFSGRTLGHTWLFATPVLRLEYQIKPKEQFAFNWRSEIHVQVAGRFSLGGEFGVRKPFGGPATWSGGPALRFKPSRSVTLEGAVHRDQARGWLLRSRALIQVR